MYFVTTPAEIEIDAMIRSERAAERAANAAADAALAALEERRACDNVQHILGGDCPVCTPDYCPGCYAIGDEPCTCPGMVALVTATGETFWVDEIALGEEAGDPYALSPEEIAEIERDHLLEDA